MGKNAKWGLVLILVGVILNNYAYLHDVVTEKHNGYIYLGARGVAAVLVGIVVIAIGAWVAARRTPPSA
jgi:hypothetical protein